MGLRDFLRSCGRLLKRARRPGHEELRLLIRICALGMIIVGIVGFIIRIIGFLFMPR